MEQHFLKLIGFLNRQPHRAGGGAMTRLPSAVAVTWGGHVIEEALAFVFMERATWALAHYQARKTGTGVSQELVPMQFLKDYPRSIGYRSRRIGRRCSRKTPIASSGQWR
jgi:hypothetical protein